MPIECSVREILLRRDLIIIITKRTCTYYLQATKLLCTNRTRQHVFGFLTMQTPIVPSDVISTLQLKKNYQFFFSNLVTDFYRIFYFPKRHQKKTCLQAFTRDIIVSKSDTRIFYVLKHITFYFPIIR